VRFQKEPKRKGEVRVDDAIMVGGYKLCHNLHAAHEPPLLTQARSHPSGYFQCFDVQKGVEGYLYAALRLAINFT
jgi:hypothetical protein